MATRKPHLGYIPFLDQLQVALFQPRLAGVSGSGDARFDRRAMALREARTAILSMPSVVIPRERNFILNPAHADFNKLAVASPEPFAFDPRMWKAKS